MKKEDFLKILREEVRPATGCTEPAAIAFVAAKAASMVQGEIISIYITVSKNIYKNSFAVTIPGTNLCGTEMSAAIGVQIRAPEKELEIFDKVDDNIIKKALAAVKNSLVQVEIDEKSYFLIRAHVKTNGQEAVAAVQNGHTNLTYLAVDGKVIFQKEAEVRHAPSADTLSLKECELDDLLEAVESFDYEDIAFMQDGIEMNLKIAAMGLNHPAALNTGKKYKNLISKGVLKDDIVNNTKMMISAACDARMGGIKAPVMTTTGSGNQGIVAILTVALVAENIGAGALTTCRAVAFSHLLATYVKQHIGKLLPVCGCAIAAGIGAAGAVTWLLGGRKPQIEGAIKNIVGNLMGMICDGAKGGCALKLATSAGEAIISAYLSMEESVVPDVEGVVAASFAETVNNMLKVCNNGMNGVDGAILDIMKNKQMEL